MRILFSIFLKDARLVRWPWLVWVVVLLAKMGVGVWFIFASHVDDAGRALAERAQQGLVSTDVALTYFLTLWMVASDSPVRALAFWRTRPISGLQLLSAKALGAVVLLVVTPLLAWLPWWMGCGLGLRGIAESAASVVFWQVLAILPAFAVASLVDSLGRAVLWSVIPAGATVVWVLGVFVRGRMEAWQFMLPLNLLGALLLSAAGVAVGVSRYQRSRGVALLLAGVLALASMQVGRIFAWMVPALPLRGAWERGAVEMARDMTLRPASPEQYFSWTELDPKTVRALDRGWVLGRPMHSWWFKEPFEELGTVWTLDGVPKDCLPIGRDTLVAEKGLSGGDEVQLSSGFNTPWWSWDRHAFRRMLGPVIPGQWASAAGDDETLESSTVARVPRLHVSTWLPSALVERWGERPATLSIDCGVELRRVERPYEGPLLASGWYTSGDYRFHAAGEELVVVRREVGLWDRMVALWRQERHEEWQDPEQQYDGFFAFDPKREYHFGPILAGLGTSNWVDRENQALVVGGVRLLRSPVVALAREWLPPGLERTDTDGIAKWAASLRLALVHTQEVARVTVHGQVDDFSLRPVEKTEAGD